LQKEHSLLLANVTELSNALTINPLLDQLPTTMTYQLPLHLKQRNKITHHSSASWLNRLIIVCYCNIRVGLCCLTECITGTFWLTNRDVGTKPLNRVCPG